MKKRILCLVIVLCMVVSMLPITASAAYSGTMGGSKHSHSFVGGVCSTCGYSVLDEEWIAPDFAEGDYTMIAIPDTQIMVEYWPEAFRAQMQWIADNKDTMNIQAVLHMGDMVNGDVKTQWATLKSGTDILDAAGLVWMPMRGNHDNSDMFNNAYPYASYGLGRSYFGGSYESGKLDHYYAFVTVGSREYVIMNLGWMPTYSVLSWAKGIVEEHSDKNIIISCHAYMHDDGTPLTWETDMSDSIRNEIMANLSNGLTMDLVMSFIPDGDAIWETFKGYENVVLALSGHVHSADIVTFTDKNGAGKNVSSLLIDRQDDDWTGHLGMLAVLSFNTANDKVSVNWYSTEYDALYRADNQFEINVPHVTGEGKHVHEYTTEEVVDPTCTEKGYTEYSCRCGDSEKVNYVEALGHKWDEGKVTKEPTEESKGEKTYTCGMCGETRTTSIPKLEHTHKYSSAVTAPTCTEKGYTEYSCQCGNIERGDYVEALGHKWDEGKLTKEPTEEAEGVMAYTCGNCGETKTEAIAKLEHTHKYASVVTAPTCTEKGYTEYSCQCGNIERGDYVEVLGHKWDEGKLTKEPTEEAEGIKTYTCGSCGETKTEAIAKLEHTHKYTSVVTAPTCTGEGYTTHSCACGDSYTDSTVPASGHKWDNGKLTKEPTEDAEGVKTFTCTSCGETKTEAIAKLEHTHKYTSVVTAPTCTGEGYTTHSCACGDSYTDSTVPATGHKWDNGKVTKEPTEDAEGVKTYTCGSCGETRTEAIAKLEHTHKYTSVVTAPTCTGEGYTTHSCACGDSYTDSTVPAAGHKWDDVKVTKIPTEIDEGEMVLSCVICGESKTEKIDKVVVNLPVCEHEYVNEFCIHCKYREPHTEMVDINFRKIKIVIDGMGIIPCDANGNTVEPFIMSATGTTYLPVRAISQALGLDVQWDAATNTVRLNSGGTYKTGNGPASQRIEQINTAITYRNIKVTLNGEQLSLENRFGEKAEPFILNSNSSVYLPLRVISEALGITVYWDGELSAVYLSSMQK